MKLDEFLNKNRTIENFKYLLDDLLKKKLLGREFAEAFYYRCFMNPKQKGISFDFKSYWEECLKRLDSKEKEILFRFNSIYL